MTVTSLLVLVTVTWVSGSNGKGCRISPQTTAYYFTYDSRLLWYLVRVKYAFDTLQCLFGNGYHGDVAGDWLAPHRTSMYLEVVLQLLLYHLRSFYSNLDVASLTRREILNNRQVGNGTFSPGFFLDVLHCLLAPPGSGGLCAVAHFAAERTSATGPRFGQGICLLHF